MQKAAKVLGSQLREAYASRQQLESQLSNESQIADLERQISDLAQSKEGKKGNEKGNITRRQNALGQQIEELREVKIENPEAQARLDEVNANISRLEQHVTYVPDPSNLERGNYKAVGSGFTREHLAEAAVERTKSIRNAYNTMCTSALAGNEAEFNAAVESLNSFFAGMQSTKAKESLEGLVQRQRDVLQSELDYAASPIRGPIKRRLELGMNYADGAVAAGLTEARTYVDTSVANARQEARDNYNNLTARMRRWVAYGAAAFVLATGVAIGGYFAGRGGDVALTDADKQDIAALVTPVPGSQGARGERGPAGSQGQQGLKGDTGATGQVGPPGPQGGPGAPGRDGVVDYTSQGFQDALDAAVANALERMQPPTTPTPTPGNLAELRAASSYGFSYALARAMYNFNPAGFVAAFGVVPQAAPQVANWFDGNLANAEATAVNGAVMRVEGSTARVHLLADGRGAQFTVDPAKAKDFTLDYLAANPGQVSEVVY